jgi:L-threonylcarbamoyladenylate synthase
VRRIYAAKGRPAFNPLIVHVADLAAAEAVAHLDRRARDFARQFWPGPLTLVLPWRASARLAAEVTAGLSTVAIRVPASPLAQHLLHAAERPLAAPSANRSGTVSPTRAEHVARSLGAAVDLILDGGACPVGVESTILDLSGAAPVILRPGGVSREMLEQVGGPLAESLVATDQPKAPGQLLAHYAPARPVRLNAGAARPGEALIGFGPAPEDAVANLSLSGDLAEAAARLFAILHEFDRPPFTGLAFMPVPDVGLGRAINDRLRRASYREADPDES